MRTETKWRMLGQGLAILTLTAALAGCGGSSDASSTSGTAGTTGTTGTTSVAGLAPSVSGTPPTVVAANNRYRFQPTVANPTGGPLSFSIQNKPNWAAFGLSTGELSGIPDMPDAGKYPNIVIAASDGKSTAVMPAFAIQVTASASPPASSSSGGASSSSSGASKSSSSSSSSSSSGASKGSSSSSGISGASALSGLHTVGAQIVNGTGQVIQLHGVNHASTEYMCPSGGFNDGHLTQADFTALKGWRVNAVRVPLNESCWLNIGGPSTGGAKYQSALRAYVNLIVANGMIPILDLHWTAPGSELAKGQAPMPDADHSIQFWKEVATAFASSGPRDSSVNSSIIFDLFNEPHDISWDCWLNGGCQTAGVRGTTGPAVGMATLYQTVRATGAQNVVIIAGTGWAHRCDVANWVARIKSIPGGVADVACSEHWYGGASTSDVDLPGVVGAGFPVVMSEGDMTEVNQVFALGQSMTLWNYGDAASPVLLTNWSGGLTSYGQAYLNWLLTKF